MPAMSPERRQVRSRIANIARDNPSSPELVELRREFAALKIADFIQEVLADAPALNDSQRVRLIMLLGGRSVQGPHA